MSFWYKSAKNCQCHPNCSCQAERQGPWTSCFFLCFFFFKLSQFIWVVKHLKALFARRWLVVRSSCLARQLLNYEKIFLFYIIRLKTHVAATLPDRVCNGVLSIRRLAVIWPSPFSPHLLIYAMLWEAAETRWLDNGRQPVKVISVYVIWWSICMLS